MRDARQQWAMGKPCQGLALGAEGKWIACLPPGNRPKALKNDLSSSTRKDGKTAKAAAGGEKEGSRSQGAATWETPAVGDPDACRFSLFPNVDFGLGPKVGRGVGGPGRHRGTASFKRTSGRPTRSVERFPNPGPGGEPPQLFTHLCRHLQAPHRWVPLRDGVR